MSRGQRSAALQLEYLNLSNTSISDSSILALQCLFDNSPVLDPHPKNPPNTLLCLDLSKNNITENGLTYLADLIAQKRLISNLNISYSTMLSGDFLD